MRTDQMSQSAAFIAVKLYGLTKDHRYRSLFDNEVLEYYDRVVRSLPAPIRYYHYWLKWGGIRSLYIKSEELFLPGDLMHIVARKWYINRILDKLLDQGFDQILVLGGGFDHVSLIHSQKNIPCLETDSPHMAQLKEQFLSNYYPDASHPTIVPMHLPQNTLWEVLNHQQLLSPNQKTIVIAEGFFDYLQKGTVQTVFSTIHDYFTATALISTHFALNELSTFHRFVFRSSLQLVGEDLQFNTSMDTLKSLLSDQHFTIQQCIDTQKIETDFLSTINNDLPILNGFYLFTAHTADTNISYSAEH